MKYEEIENTVAKWEATGLLEGVDNKSNLALCLESQRLFNEQHDGVPLFKRLSIPIIRRLFGESEAFKNNDFTNYFEDNDFPKILQLGVKFNEGLADEVEYCAALTKVLAEEIDQAFADKYNSEITFRGLDILNNEIVMYYS